MAIDYASMQQFATGIIAANGKALTFQQHNSTPADPAKPWRGSGASSQSSKITCIGVVVPDDQDDDKEAMKRGDATAYISATSFSTGVPPSQQQLEMYNTMVDPDGYVWRVVRVSIVNPGPLRVVYTVRLEH